MSAVRIAVAGRAGVVPALRRCGAHASGVDGQLADSSARAVGGDRAGARSAHGRAGEAGGRARHDPSHDNHADGHDAGDGHNEPDDHDARQHGSGGHYLQHPHDHAYHPRLHDPRRRERPEHPQPRRHDSAANRQPGRHDSAAIGQPRRRHGAASHYPRPLSVEQTELDVAVVGAGAAGLYATLCAARAGARVALVSATPLAQTASYWAQGGLAAALAADDSFALHLSDTEKAGRGAARGVKSRGKP